MIYVATAAVHKIRWIFKSLLTRQTAAGVSLVHLAVRLRKTSYFSLCELAKVFMRVTVLVILDARVRPCKRVCGCDEKEMSDWKDEGRGRTEKKSCNNKWVHLTTGLSFPSFLLDIVSRQGPERPGAGTPKPVNHSERPWLVITGGFPTLIASAQGVCCLLFQLYYCGSADIF